MPADGPGERTELEEASEHLRRAAETTSGDVRDRLETQADRFADAATRERGPDQGWLDRHTHVVRELGDEAGGEAADHVRAAVERINEYRKGVSGV